MELTYQTGSAAYLDLLAILIMKGSSVSARSQPARELQDVTVTVTKSVSAHVLRTGRHPKPEIAATEAMHLLAGVSSLEQLNAASNGKFSEFADGGRLLGAYGPRAWHQLPLAAARVSADSQTRQAAVSIWRGDELLESSRDVPCTLSYQFLLRDGSLHLRTSMRSNDAWLGFPYDLEVASCLHRAMAWALGASLGTYTHSVASMHLYLRDLEKAEKVIALGTLAQQRPVTQIPVVTTPPVTPVARWNVLAHEALNVVRGKPLTLGNLELHWVPPLSATAQLCASCRYITSEPCDRCAPQPSPPPPAVTVPAGELL